MERNRLIAVEKVKPQLVLSAQLTDIFIEMILRLLKISGVLSQQFESQHDIPSKVIYVQAGWLSSFIFKVTSTRLELKDGFSSHNVRIYPKSLVEHVCTTMLSNHST